MATIIFVETSIPISIVAEFIDDVVVERALLERGLIRESSFGGVRWVR
jgi:hypothetical protein